MTEDDTFKRLCKATFNELNKELLQLVNAEQEIHYTAAGANRRHVQMQQKIKAVAEAAGWTHDEFKKESRRRILARVDTIY